MCSNHIQLGGDRFPQILVTTLDGFLTPHPTLSEELFNETFQIRHLLDAKTLTDLSLVFNHVVHSSLRFFPEATSSLTGAAILLSPGFGSQPSIFLAFSICWM